MLKVSGHGSIRKIKGGAAGIITLSALFLGLQGVSADEVTSTTTSEPATKVSSSTEKDAPKKVEDKSKSVEVSANTSTEKKVEAKATEKEVPKDTDKETFTKAESKEFDIAKKDAKDNGVSVKEDTKPSIKDSEKDAQEDLAKQTKDLKAAQKTQVGSDAITNLDKEKLTEAGIKVKDGKIELFTDLEKMEAFVKQQSKDIAKDIESKHGIEKDVALATKELKGVGIEVVVGAEVVKASPEEALKAVAELQKQVTNALKTKQDLDSAFLALQERAKAAGLLTKEGKTVTLESARDAKDFLAKQTEEVNVLIKSLTEGNKQVKDAVAKAESYGVKVTTTAGTKVDTIENLTKLVSTQVSKFDALIKSIEENKGLINSTVAKAKQAGVSLEGETVVNLAKGEQVSLKDKVASALKDLEVATQLQSSTKADFEKLVSDARAKGLTVNITGTKKVEISGVSKELEAIKTKIAQALTNKNKAQADYETALKNSQEASRLVEGSTATKSGDVYKQTLTIKSNGTKGSVSIKATGSAEIVSVELVDPTGKKVESVKTLADLTAYTDFSKTGNYTVNYTFRAKDNGAGSVVSSGNTQGVAAVEGKASGKLTVTTKASVTTNVTNDSKPTVLDIVLDFSSSYRYKIFDSIDQAKMLINDALTNDKSKVIIQAYNYNSTTSYGVQNGDTVGYSTTLLTKQEALDILNKLKALAKRQPSLGSSDAMGYNEYFATIGKTFGDKNYSNPTATTPIKPFEDVVRQFITSDDIVSVIQFTDGWNGGESNNGVTAPVENIDFTFADWAKVRAKTFMTVINKNVTKASEGASDKDTNSDQSVKDMQRVGHPNIYDMTGKDRAVVDKELLAKFKETAIEKVTSTKGEDQLVTVSITGTKTAKVTKATLKGATNKDLPIKDGKVNFSEKLPDGTWTVDYELSGDGDVTVTATVAGKEVVKETKNLKEVKGTEESSATKTDNLKALVTPNKPSTAPISVEGLVVTAKSVRLGSVESDATTVTIEKEIKKATFKEKVAPINFERKVVPTQAEVTTHDVYVKTPRPNQPEGKVLPKTGESSDVSVQTAGFGIGMLGLLALAGVSKRSRKED